VNVYPFIEAEKAGDHNVKRACELLEVSRAAYYAQRASRPSARACEDAELTEQITELHTTSKGRYGLPGSTPSWPGRADGMAGSEWPG
jgi:putative transposase